MFEEKGVTILEVILALVITSIIAGAGFMFSRTAIVDADLDAAAIGVVESVRRAEMLSRGSDGDSQWGVNVQSGTITLFKGASFAARDSLFDEVTDIASSIAPSGATAFTFSKLTGFPVASGTLTLSGPQSQSRNITINEKGTATY